MLVDGSTEGLAFVLVFIGVCVAVCMCCLLSVVYAIVNRHIVDLLEMPVELIVYCAFLIYVVAIQVFIKKTAP